MKNYKITAFLLALFLSLFLYGNDLTRVDFQNTVNQKKGISSWTYKGKLGTKDSTFRIVKETAKITRRISAKLRKEVREEVRKEVREEGIAIGLATGRAEGRVQGAKNTQKEIARKMLNKGMDINSISELSGLTIEEINGI